MQVAPTVSPTAVPLYMQLALGASIAGNVLLTNYATEYLSFPVQVTWVQQGQHARMHIARSDGHRCRCMT